MPRLLAAALLFALIALPAAPATAQDILAEDAQVREIEPDYDERSYPTAEAGGQGGTANWRVVRGLGNCCETYLATDAEGQLFDYGGNYVNVSRDRGQTWVEVRQPTQMLGGEGAIVAGPNGDMYGVGWDPYTGDTLVSMRYTPATGKWQTARMPLHSPFYDREWIAYVPGPITIDGDTFPFVLFVKGGYPSKEEWLYSTDGLIYTAIDAKNAEAAVNGAASEPLNVAPDQSLDLIQANGGMGLTPLGGGRALAEPDSEFSREYQLLWPDMHWQSYAFPGGMAGQLHTDSRGRLHNVVTSFEDDISHAVTPPKRQTGHFEYRLSEDGGRTFRAAKVVMPEGFRVREYDFRARGALGLAVVAVRMRDDDSGVERDFVYKFDVRGGQPVLLRSYQLGNGDLVTGANGVLSTDPRYDFESVVMFPDGRVAVSFMDTETGGQPAIGIELTDPVPAGWAQSPVPGLGPVAGKPPAGAPPTPVDPGGPRGRHRVVLKVRRRGGRVIVTGRVLPRHPGHVVRIERKRGKRWVRVAKVRAGKRSAFKTALRLRGRVVLRATAVKDRSGHSAGRSRPATLRR
jgi:hypothetical protein